MKIMKQYPTAIIVFGLVVLASTVLGFQVVGEIANKWHSLGGEKGFLHAPLTDEMSFDDKHHGRYQNFQGGSIVWSPKTGAHVIHDNQMMMKWTSLSDKFLGYPVSDESVAPDGDGRFLHCEGGSIYRSSRTPAMEVHGQIRDKWASLGWERGRLGYPTSDEFQDGVYRRSNFQGGFINWTPQQGAKETYTQRID